MLLVLRRYPTAKAAIYNRAQLDSIVRLNNQENCRLSLRGAEKVLSITLKKSN